MADAIDIQALIAAGVYDPAADDAEETLAYLRWLAAAGIDVADLAHSTDLDDLTSAASAQRMRGTPTALEDHGDIAMSVERLHELARAFGIDAESLATGRFTEAEVAALRTADAGSAMFSEEETLYFARIAGAALARMADAAVTMFILDVERPRAEVADRIDSARKSFAAVEALDVVAEALDPLFRLHMAQAAVRHHDGVMQADAPHGVRRAIGFVDLVGFTTLSASTSLEDLSLLVREFEAHAHAVVSDHGGWVVKTIGDEVMFTAKEANALVDSAADLLAEFGRSGAVEARGGLAYGDVLSRGGDYYGPVVNLAARLADIAVPGELLATEEVVAATTGDRFESAGRRQLKGFADPVNTLALRSDR